MSADNGNYFTTQNSHFDRCNGEQPALLELEVNVQLLNTLGLILVLQG